MSLLTRTTGAATLVALVVVTGGSCSLLFTDAGARNEAGHAGEGEGEGGEGEGEGEGTCDCSAPAIPPCNTALDGTCGVNGACLLSPVADNEPCAGGLCAAGACAARCFINDAIVLADASDPGGDGCQICDPSLSTSSYSPANDTSCPVGTCVSGACEPHCFVGGILVDEGDVDPNSACRTCQPAVTSIDYTDDDGLACTGTGGANICHAGACAVGCFVGGAFLEPFASSADDCSVCVPSVDVHALSALERSPCALGAGLCHAGVCAATCTDYTAQSGDASAVVLDSATPYCSTDGIIEVACATRTNASPLFPQDGDLAGVTPLADVSGDFLFDKSSALEWDVREPPVSDFPTAHAFCLTLDAGGHSDWRVPTVAEMAGMLDYGAGSLAFTNTTPPAHEHWATLGDLTPVFFDNEGFLYRVIAAGQTATVRCVRSSSCESAAPAFALDADGFALDARTQTHWHANLTGASLQSQIDACAALSPGIGWHLASVTELLAIADKHSTTDFDDLFALPLNTVLWTSTVSSSETGFWIWDNRNNAQFHLTTVSSANASNAALCVRP